MYNTHITVSRTGQWCGEEWESIGGVSMNRK